MQSHPLQSALWLHGHLNVSLFYSWLGILTVSFKLRLQLKTNKNKQTTTTKTAWENMQPISLLFTKNLGYCWQVNISVWKSRKKNRHKGKVDLIKWDRKWVSKTKLFQRLMKATGKEIIKSRTWRTQDYKLLGLETIQWELCREKDEAPWEPRRLDWNPEGRPKGKRGGKWWGWEGRTQA